MIVSKRFKAKKVVRQIYKQDKFKFLPQHPSPNNGSQVHKYEQLVKPPKNVGLVDSCFCFVSQKNRIKYASYHDKKQNETKVTYLQ